MRISSLFAIVFMLISIGVLGIGYAQEGEWEKGENRIRNSDFEDDNPGGEPAEWVLEDGGGRGAVYKWKIDKQEAHSGDRSLKIIGDVATGTDWHSKVRHENSWMEAGREFTIVFWAKVDADEANSRLVSTNVQMQHDPWTFYRGQDILLDSTDWKEYSDTFTAIADVEADMWVGLAIAQSDVDFWIDDFRFFEGKLEDELVDGEQPRIAVSPKDRLGTTWGAIKSDYR